jgi:hypothetical protein
MSSFIQNAARLKLLINHSATPITPAVQNIVAKQISLLAGVGEIKDEYHWSFAISAALAVSDEDRAAFLDRFEEVISLNAALRARKIVEQCWVRHDINIDGTEVALTDDEENQIMAVGECGNIYTLIAKITSAVDAKSTVAITKGSPSQSSPQLMPRQNVNANPGPATMLPMPSMTAIAE